MSEGGVTVLQAKCGVGGKCGSVLCPQSIQAGKRPGQIPAALGEGKKAESFGQADWGSGGI